MDREVSLRGRLQEKNERLSDSGIELSTTKETLKNVLRDWANAKANVSKMLTRFDLNSPEFQSASELKDETLAESATIGQLNAEVGLLCDDSGY